MGRRTARRATLRLRPEGWTTRVDSLAVEEPLEIRLGGRPLAVTMRTPGDDVELAVGFLLAEGVIRAAADVAGARYCAGTDATGANTYNVLDVTLVPGAAVGAMPERNFAVTSACGLCGRASIEQLRARSAYRPADDPLRVTAQLLASLPAALRAAQRTFATTGGLHGAGLFDATGTLVCAREDVGRHNAVDKVVGWAAKAGRLPLTGHLLLVSGRASFELTQKAYLAGIPLLAAVSAPSSLAVELAAEVGMTLVGFLRGPAANVYAGDWRLVGQPVTVPRGDG